MSQSVTRCCEGEMKCELSDDTYFEAAQATHVGNELVVVLARSLETEQHDERLLKPVGGLEEVVELELRTHLPVRVLCVARAD